MFLLREARPDDKRPLLELARELDSVNLPTDGDELGETLKRSSRSFRGRVRDRSRAVYIFCAEDVDTGKVAGALSLGLWLSVVFGGIFYAFV